MDYNRDMEHGEICDVKRDHGFGFIRPDGSDMTQIFFPLSDCHFAPGEARRGLRVVFQRYPSTKFRGKFRARHIKIEKETIQ